MYPMLMVYLKKFFIVGFCVPFCEMQCPVGLLI